MNKNALIIAVSIMLSRVLGIVREMLLADIAGINYQKNALDLAFLIPDILNHVVSTGFLTITFIPIFTGYLVKDKEDKAWEFFSIVLTTLSVILLVLIIPAWIFMEPLILLFTSEAPTPRVLALAVEYGRVILPAQLFFLVGTFFVSVQHIRQRFLLPALTGVIYNVAIIVGGYLGKENGLIGFAWGVPIGSFMGFFILQLIGVSKCGVKYKPGINITHPDLIRFIKLTLPLMIGVGAMFALDFVTKAFGTSFGEKGVSSLNYAYKMMYTIVATFGFSVGVASYPALARMVKEGKLSELNIFLFSTLDKMIAILLPVVIATWLSSDALLQILFERGEFGRDATNLVSSLMRWYLPASIALCFQVVIVRCFYAMEKMWLPTIINSLIFIISLPFYTILGQKIGIIGVPITSVIASYFQVVILMLLWGKINSWENFKPAAINITKAMVAFLINLLVFAFLSTKWAGFERDMLGNVLTIILLGGGAFALQLVLQVLLGCTSTSEVVNKLLKKFKIKS